MTVDQLARPSAEEFRLLAADSDAVTQLLQLSTDRLFAECCFVEVWPAFDVAAPFRSDLLGGDFRIHHGKACGYVTLEVNDHAICCGAEQNAQPLVLPRVDAHGRDHDQDRKIVRSGAADVALLIRDSRSKHIRRDSFLVLFRFAHGPPITRLLVPSRAHRNLHALGAIYHA